MKHLHVRFEVTRDDSYEGYAVAVLRVHVRLDLEHEARERRVFRLHVAGVRFARPRRRRQLQELAEKRLDAEIRERRAEEDRRKRAVDDPVVVVRMPGRIEQLDVRHEAIECTLAHHFKQCDVVDAHDRVVGPCGATVSAAFEQMHFALEPVVHAYEDVVVEHGPRGSEAVDTEIRLDILNELERIFPVPVALVYEREDRRATLFAHVEQLPGAFFHTATIVEQHDGAVGRDQRAIRVFREIFVPRRIEQVELIAQILELQHGAGDRDAAFLLELHPVGGGVPRGTPCLDRAGEVDGAAVQEQLLGQRGLTGVGVRDDRKGPAPGDFMGEAFGGNSRRDSVSHAES